MHDHTPPPPPARWTWRELLALAAVVAVLVFGLNRGGWDGYEAWLTKNLTEPDRVFRTHDEYFLIGGYRKAPDPWRDGLAWWHGNWIHQYTAFLRPLGSYLHWAHIHVGLRYGWHWLGWLGLTLFWAANLVAAAFAWRVTRSKPATVFGALLLPFHALFNNSQPPHWAAWWPGHPDIITGGLIVGSLLCLDLWYERGTRRLLAAAWLLLAFACGFKEHAYILPAMAFVLAALRGEAGAAVPRRRRLLQAALMLAAVVALFIYRKSVLPGAGAPPVLPLRLVTDTAGKMYKVFTYPLASGDVAQHLAATLLYAQGYVWVWLRRHSAPLRRWLARPFAGVAALFGMLGLTVGVLAATDTLILFADPAIGRRLVAGLFVPVWAAYYATYLLVRYRRGYPVAMIWLLLLLAYLPVYNTVTWYYTTIGWLFRASYWALLAQIAWRHWGLERAMKVRTPGRHIARLSFARLPVEER